MQHVEVKQLRLQEQQNTADAFTKLWISFEASGFDSAGG